MAKLYNDFQAANLMSFGKSFSRLNGQPLDKSEAWFDLESAQAYARTDAAYVGQKIFVVNSDAGTVTHYSIKNVAGDLEELGAATLGDNKSIELSGKVLSLKNFGKQYYKYLAVGDTDKDGNEVTSAKYELTEGFIDGLEVKVREVSTSADDGTVTKSYELAYYQPNPTTVEGLSSQIASLTTQIQGAADAAAEAKSIAESKISDVKGTGAVVASVDEGKVATIKINLDNSGNVQFSETDSGLKAEVEIPAQAEYSIKKLDESSEGASASYQLTKDGTGVGAVIDIPKDMVVSSGSVVVNPEGQPEGTYIEIVLANAESSKLYINVGNLIEYVTSGSVEGDMIFVAVDPVTHKVTATVTDGTVTKSKLTAEVQASLDKADSAMQSVTILGFELKNGDELTVDQAKTALGLGSAAYESLDDVESTMDQKIEAALAWGSIG